MKHATHLFHAPHIHIPLAEQDDILTIAEFLGIPLLYLVSVLLILAMVI